MRTGTTSHWIIPAFLLLISDCEGHIGEKCNLIFRKCLPDSPHVYCDDDFICRCDPKFPIVVGLHSCKAPKKIGERCSHTKECNFTDPFSYCTKVPFATECQCNDGYEFDFNEEKCVRSNRPRRPPSADKVSILTSTVLFLLGCLGVLSVFIFLYQLFCHQPVDNTWRSSTSHLPSNRRTDVRLRPSDDIQSASRQSYRYSNGSSILGLGHLPTYDSATFNQPPPSYDEAIKGSQVLEELFPPSSEPPPPSPPPPADGIPDVITTTSSTTAFQPTNRSVTTVSAKVTNTVSDTSIMLPDS